MNGRHVGLRLLLIALAGALATSCADNSHLHGDGRDERGDSTDASNWGDTRIPSADAHDAGDVEEGGETSTGEVDAKTHDASGSAPDGSDTTTCADSPDDCSMLDARETVEAYKKEFDLIIQSTESSAAQYRHLDVPDELLDANEALVPETDSTVAVLDANEATFVATQVSDNEELLRAEEVTQPVTRKANHHPTCGELSESFQSTAQLIERGGELLQSIRTRNTNATQASASARRLAETLLYGFWTETLHAGFEQYEDYLSACAETSYELRDGNDGTQLERIVAGLQYVPIVRRVVQLLEALLIDAVEDTRVALSDVVSTYQDILNLSEALDTSFLSMTVFTEDLEGSEVEVSVPADAPVLLDFVSGLTGVLEVTWLELFGEPEVLDLNLQILDLTNGRAAQKLVEVEVPASPVFCRDPGSHDLDGKYLMSLGGELLGSNILFEFNATPESAGLALSITPLVRDSCAGLGGLLGCVLGGVPRLLLGLPVVGDILTQVGSSTELLFDNLELSPSAWEDVPGNGGTFALRLDLKPCGTEDFCGDGFLESTDGSGFAAPVSFAATRVNSVSSSETPNPKSSCPEL